MSYIVAELYEALIAAGGLLSGFCSMTVNHAMSLIYCRSFCLHPDRQAFPPALLSSRSVLPSCVLALMKS